MKAVDWNVIPSVFGVDISKSSRQDIEIQNTQQLGADNRVVWGGDFDMTSQSNH